MIDAPKSSFTSAAEAVGLPFQWEKEVTSQINSLMEIAIRENDYLGRQFLDWFVSEQLEEVSKMDKLFNVVRSVGEENIYMLEAYLSRVS